MLLWEAAARTEVEEAEHLHCCAASMVLWLWRVRALRVWC